jgi:hypothetical protein
MALERLRKWVTRLPSCVLGCRKYHLGEAFQIPANITQLFPGS